MSLQYQMYLRPKGSKSDSWAVMVEDKLSSCLGIIRYYTPSREYRFEPQLGALMTAMHLKEIATFCEEATNNQKNGRSTR